MTAPLPTLDPACADDDVFFDAVVGLDRVSRWLAGEIDRAVVTATDAAITAGSADDADAPVSELDEPLAAVLGLVSLQTTLSLVLAALAGEPGEAGPEAGAAWSRELLR